MYTPSPQSRDFMELFDYQKLAKEECYHIEKEIMMLEKKISYLNKRIARARTLQNLLQVSQIDDGKIKAVQLDMLAI